MFGLLKKLFGAKQAVETVEVKAEAPYKVEVPTQVAEKATEAVVSSIVPAKAAAPKKQGGNKPKQGGNKPKQGGNKPRKPKAPKVPKA